MQNLSSYCNVACYFGLLAYPEMADAAGYESQAESWRVLAARLRKAMDAYYPAQQKPWGDVWDETKSAAFYYGNGTLTPLIHGTDFYGYDVAHRFSPDWAARTRRTYLCQLTKNELRWTVGAGLGYGQSHITQSALLLDEMRDAAPLVNWLTRFCYAPRQTHPFRVPEGATLDAGGKSWRRWGDLGNLYQMAEVVYTTHVMLGIEDLDASRVLAMPRLPRGLDGFEVANWPLRACSDGTLNLIKLRETFALDAARKSASLNLQTDAPLDVFRARLGPFLASTRTVAATLNGSAAKPILQRSGDSVWAWIPGGDGKTKTWKVSIRKL